MPAFSRKTILATALLTAVLLPTLAQARNLEIEASLRQLGDVSDFYRALLYSGVANELNENQNYTILAPTNAAFTILSHENYPCFYSSQCREQTAAFVRAHIILGRHSLPMMVRHVRMEAGARTQMVFEEPFNKQYTVNGQDILSSTDTGHSVIYRVNGLVVNQKYLNVFQTANYHPTGEVMQQTTTTYVVPNQDVINAQGDPSILPGVNADSTTVQKTTTITNGYQPAEDWQ